METEKNGRRFFIQTFGCQMNVHDSAAMAGIMAARGYGAASGPEEADLIIVNTCSVRERAYQKVRSAVGALRRFKDRRGRGPVIVVAGCVARQEGERWLELCPHVDIVMGPDGLVRLADLVRRVQKGQGPVVDTAFDEGRPGDFASPPVCSGRSSAYVTVSKGCSGACSFCIVPFLRGPERCRPAGDVVRDVAGLAAAGVKEVCLLGQTVNSWSSAGRSFADLLAMADSVEGLERIRYTSPYPGHVTEDLARAHADLASLCEHMHLPVQSGSNRILRRMNRGYSADDYLRAVDLLRRYRPDLALSTDMIVGFPGETDEDFERTLELVRRVGFDTMFSFKYSPRPGTAAADWADDVPAKVKQARLEALHDLADESTAAAWAGDLGRDVEVLVEGRGRRPGQLSGRTRKNRIVNFSCGEGAAIPQPGDLAAVRIHEVLPHSLRGILAGT
jgi:tRNA-2-methylthio-N6-dimethylallyladenosine synthase